MIKHVNVCKTECTIERIMTVAFVQSYESKVKVFHS